MIFIFLFLVLGLSSITNLLILAEPIIILKEKVGITTENKNKYIRFFAKLLSCALCLGFWVGLFFTWNILLAAIISVGSEFLYRRLIS